MLVDYSKLTADASSQLNAGGQLLTARFHNGVPGGQLLTGLPGYSPGRAAAAFAGSFALPGYAPGGVVLWVVVALWLA